MLKIPSIGKRKVLRQGKSLAVSLPADFRRYYNLKPKDEVIVLYDGVVIIIPKQEAEILKDPEKRKLIRKLLK